MTVYQNNSFQNKMYGAEFPFRTIVKRDLVQLRHNPHPIYVKHVKGFLGQPTQLVETEKDEIILSQSTVEGFIQDSIKKGIWNYNNDSKKFVKKSKDLDEILSLQYFTGLQNFSFKENYLPYLGYREYFNSWRQNLRNLSINAYQPIIDQTKSKNKNPFPNFQHPNEWNKYNSDSFRCKSMYSASGRLSVCQDIDRKLSTRNKIRSQQRISTGLSNKLNETDENLNFNNLDASVFVLIGNLLQTTSAHVVQNWLSKSTDREKALMISMIQNVLSNQNSNQSFFEDGPTEKGTQTSKFNTTPESRIEESQNNVKKISKSEDKCDILVVDQSTSSEVTKEKLDEIRPPTSSTFRPIKNSGLSNSKASKLSPKSTMWIQEKSLNISN